MVDNYAIAHKQFLDSSNRGFLLHRPEKPLPLHINWTKLNEIGYILKSNLDEHTEELLKECIKTNVCLNSENRCVPSLTAVLIHADEKENHQILIRLMQLLLDNGADPCYISRNTCIRPETVPDAIVMAAFFECESAVRLLLQYWWVAPLGVLDSWLGNHIKQFIFWFPMLSAYGWIHGSLIAEITEEYIGTMIETSNNRDLWVGFQTKMRQPCSLKQLARLVLRESTAKRAKADELNFTTELKKYEVPVTVSAFLLMQIP